MAIRKTMVLREDGGDLFLLDTIEYEGKLWLVPDWIEGPIPGTSSPVRIICVDGPVLQKPGPQYKADYLLTIPLSTDVLEGRKVMPGLVVIERPDIVQNLSATLQ